MTCVNNMKGYDGSIHFYTIYENGGVQQIRLGTPGAV